MNIVIRFTSHDSHEHISKSIKNADSYNHFLYRATHSFFGKWDVLFYKFLSAHIVIPYQEKWIKFIPLEGKVEKIACDILENDKIACGKERVYVFSKKFSQLSS